ncbi:MAG TPA: DUF4376 domain-containing protein [Devosia sp.]|jgi:hypothetical protein|nr:DUF4376 domain-containing protein [Devosia sp.]
MLGAVIRNGEVANIIIVERPGDFGTVPCADHVGIGWTYAGGKFAAPDTASSSTLAEVLAAKFSELDRKRRAVEEGGIIFNGVPLKTDRQTASIITAAYVKAKENPAFQIPNWKFSDGVFAPLDAATIIAAGDAISAHVQSAFDREAALTAELLAMTEIDDVLAFDVQSEW